MKRILLLTLKIFGGIVIFLLVLLIGGAVALNNSSVQNKMVDYATEMLQEKLNTKVSIDSVSVNFLRQKASIKGLYVEDQQQRTLLQAERLGVEFDLWDLLQNKVEISEAHLEGVKARLYHPKDSVANYQFVIDAFKKDKTKKPKEPKEKKKGQQLSLDVKDLKISKIDVVYNEDTFLLGSLQYARNWRGKHEGHIFNLKGAFETVTKKGEQRTNKFRLAHLYLHGKDENLQVDIDSLRFAIDNHLPRKNADKPNRGFFDIGHLDVLASMKLKVNHLGKDTAHVTMTNFVARDSVTGFNIKDFRFNAGINKELAHLTDVTIQQENTVLTFDEGTLYFPSKKKGKKLAYKTSLISGTTLLKDISRPFVPALRNFTIPLELKVLLSGTDEGMKFSDIHVNTQDQRFALDADGGITNLNEKEELDIRFHVKDMKTTGNVAEEIINQFMVKKFMMKQLKNLGTIGFVGDVIIIWKKEIFQGLLRTDAGNLNVNLVLDEDTKYILGTVRTSGIHLGKVVEMKDIGDVALTANFNFDFSKPRTAQMRKLKGGKLPIGKINATVQKASFKKIHFDDIDVTINSDGAVAQGNLHQRNKLIDVLCSFSFTSTDSIHKMKIRPNLKWHKSQDNSLEKQRKKEEKAAKKQQKAEEKALKKQQKAAAKAEKKRLKAEAKAAKKQQKD